MLSVAFPSEICCPSRHTNGCALPHGVRPSGVPSPTACLRHARLRRGNTMWLREYLGYLIFIQQGDVEEVCRGGVEITIDLIEHLFGQQRDGDEVAVS